MPGIHPHQPSGVIYSVQREVLVYERTHISRVESLAGGFYLQIHSNLIAQVWSDQDGHFSIPLEPGLYSLFVRENDLYYANRGDGLGYIMPVEVLAGEVCQIVFDIDYEAVF